MMYRRVFQPAPVENRQWDVPKSKRGLQKSYEPSKPSDYNNPHPGGYSKRVPVLEAYPPLPNRWYTSLGAHPGYGWVAAVATGWWYGYGWVPEPEPMPVGGMAMVGSLSRCLSLWRWRRHPRSQPAPTDGRRRGEQAKGVVPNQAVFTASEGHPRAPAPPHPLPLSHPSPSLIPFPLSPKQARPRAYLTQKKVNPRAEIFDKHQSPAGRKTRKTKRKTGCDYKRKRDKVGTAQPSEPVNEKDHKPATRKRKDAARRIRTQAAQKRRRESRRRKRANQKRCKHQKTMRSTRKKPSAEEWWGRSKKSTVLENPDNAAKDRSQPEVLPAGPQRLRHLLAEPITFMQKARRIRKRIKKSEVENEPAECKNQDEKNFKAERQAARKVPGSAAQKKKKKS